MSNVINLNKFRKKKERAADKKCAEENRAKFGRTKTEKKKDKQANKKLQDHVDAHAITTPQNGSDESS